MKDKEKEIICMNDKLRNLEEKNVKLEFEVRTVLENVKAINTVVKDSTEAAAALMSKKQDEIEKHNEARLDTLTNQLALIFNLLQPS
jgi:translation initiation factor 2B subunit (eIF-2B alpha/beta/delta family)